MRNNAMNDEFVIQVNVAGKTYKLRCRRDQEQLYRVAVRQINDKILQYQSKYGKHVELNDLLSMALLHYSLGSVKAEKNEDITPVFDKLDDLNSDIEQFIRSNN